MKCTKCHGTGMIDKKIKRCKCLALGYNAQYCKKRRVCADIERPLHTKDCWDRLTTNPIPYSTEPQSLYLCKNT